VIESEQVSRTDSKLQNRYPILTFLLAGEVKNSRFVRRNDYLGWPECGPGFRTLFIRNILDEGIGQTMHHPVVLINRCSIEVNFISLEYSPVLFKPVSLCF
jgi:hypothetical protein